LREGLDLPEVSLVIILDADKEGFLRSNRSLTQTIGRAARNINGKAIMYADKITRSMEKTINETKYRRKKQIDYNTLNNLVPRQINKTLNNSLSKNSKNLNLSNGNESKNITQNLNMKSKKNIKKEINLLKKEMEKAAKDLNFLEAARLRDLIVKLKDYLN
jgi:excinuclease ABC subunit B